MRRRTRFITILLTVFVLWLEPAGSALAETAVAVQMMKTEGTVTVTNSSARELKIMEKMRLYNGYFVSTDEKSYAWLNLDDTKLVKVDALSRVELRKDGKKLELLVHEGTVFFNITEPLEDDETLDICTATMVAGIRGTSGWMQQTEDMETELCILEGETQCAFTNPITGEKKVSVVSSGEIARFSGGEEKENCNIEIQKAEQIDIPGFVLEEIAGDTELQDEILDKSGIDLRNLAGEEVQARLGQDQFDAAGKLQQIIAGINDRRVVSQDPVWKAGTEDPVGDTPGRVTVAGTGPVTRPAAGQVTEQEAELATELEIEPDDEDDVPETYTVRYMLDGVQVGEAETYEYGAVVTVREKAVKEGYTVTDWSRTGSFTMPAEDVVITASSTVNAQPTATPSPEPTATVTPATPTPEPTATVTPTTPTPEPTATVTPATPTPEPPATVTPEPTPEPTATVAPTTPTPEPTATVTPATPTPEPTATVTPATPTPEPTATVTPATPTPEPTATVTPATPTPEPTATVTPEPTATPTPEPTATVAPTTPTPATPTPEPTATVAPTTPTPEPPATVTPATPTPEPTATVAPTTPTPEPPATVTPEPTATVAPTTPTPEPTATVMPATPTPEPTATVTPATPTPEPTATVAPTTPTPEPTATVMPATPTPEPPATPTPEPTATVTPATPTPEPTATPSPTPTYTVTFDANGGTLAGSNTVTANYNTTVTLPESPTKAGYAFKGWFTQKEEGTEFTAATVVTETCTLYAQWTAEEAKIVFDANGGSNAPQGITGVTDAEIGGENVFPTTEPTREGYTFLGWYPDKDGSGEAVSVYPGSFPAGTTTYYAKWGYKAGDFTVVGGIPGADQENHNDYFYSDEYKILTIYSSTEIMISGTTKINTIEVATGVEANVTLSNLSIEKDYSVEGVTEYSPFALLNGASATITLAGDNILKDEKAAALEKDDATGKLTIKGSGSLTAESGGGAGIGAGSNYATTGNIFIESGTIVAKGAGDYAGIGGGYYYGNESCDGITISGGNITAVGGQNAAGIGGGLRSNGINITIFGGKVTATGGINGAGIGGGGNADDADGNNPPPTPPSDYNETDNTSYHNYTDWGQGGHITISGGTVIATGGKNGGAGIGGGHYGGCGVDISITGGTVIAAGGENGGAGIGGGNNSGTGTSSVGGSGSVSITGGTVKATAGTDASAIGKGRDGSSEQVTPERGIIFACTSGQVDGKVYGEVTLDSDLEIKSGETLLIPSGSKLIIPEGKTLTNNGAITYEASSQEDALSGNLQGNGTISGPTQITMLTSDGEALNPEKTALMKKATTGKKIVVCNKRTVIFLRSTVLTEIASEYGSDGDFDRGSPGKV